MLSLESPRWETLTHAYGAAGDIPELLRAAERASADAWHEIWSALCHQGSVYPATYGAIPHIVDIASRANDEDGSRAECLIFVGAVVMSRDAAAIPDDLATDYAAALTRAESLLEVSLAARDTPETTFVELLRAFAALRGCVRTAELLEGFVHGEFLPRCPADTCGVEIYVSIDGAPMFATLEDPATEDVEERLPVIPPPALPPVVTDWSDRNVLPALVALAERAGQRALATRLALWDGTVTCPKCRADFPLRATLVDPTEL